MAARITPEQRQRYATLSGGRFPIFNCATVRSAIRLRGRGTTRAEREKIVRAAYRVALQKGCYIDLVRRAAEEDGINL